MINTEAGISVILTRLKRIDLRFDEKGIYYNENGKISSKPKILPSDLEKFKIREELPDGSGFRLNDGTIYYYTENGGW